MGVLYYMWVHTTVTLVPTPHLPYTLPKQGRANAISVLVQSGTFEEYMFSTHSSKGYGGEAPLSGGEHGCWCGQLEYQGAVCHSPGLDGHTG